MQKLKFIFGIHCHQPVGNFENIFEETYQKAYLPFIETIESHPKIKFAAHYSGVLYDWFMKAHPEFIERLRKLVRRRQIEVLSGGYYEPILCLIPDQDKIGQIEMQNHFIKDKLGGVVQGLWLTERVWEPSLPKPLSQVGIEYIMLDDHHFTLAGVPQEKLFGYYVTEEEGKILKIFPINHSLRYLIPFKAPEESIDYLKTVHGNDENRVVVHICDGEKFGARPGTDKLMQEERYLEKLLTLLEENSDWIECVTPSSFLEEYPPLGRIYLPAASYPEMMEWSGGNFRNFLIKYPEANNMHKKMLYVSDRLDTLKKGKALVGQREKDQRLKGAVQELYKGQCNCAYWHGIFGGIYLNHLRHAVYSHLIQAETEIEKFTRGSRAYVDLTIMDFDKDGNDEVLLSNNLLNLYFAPAYGGALFELDYKPKAYNLTNGLSQRGGGNLRLSLLDHFISPDTSLDAFSSNSCEEAGDFIANAYSFMPKRKGNEVVLILSRSGQVAGMPVRVEKTVSLCSKQSIINVEYIVTNLGKETDEFWFGIEFNFAMLAGNTPDRYYTAKGASLKDKRLESVGEIDGIRVFKIVDEWSKFDVSLEMNKPALLWRFPAKTLFRSETESKEGYQSSVVFPNWNFSLEPMQKWEVKITLRIEE